MFFAPLFPSLCTMLVRGGGGGREYCKKWEEGEKRRRRRRRRKAPLCITHIPATNKRWEKTGDCSIRRTNTIFFPNLFPMNTGLSNGNPAEGKQHIFKKIWAFSRICAVKKKERRGRKKRGSASICLAEMGAEGERGNKICRTQKETTSNHSFPFPPSIVVHVWEGGRQVVGFCVRSSLSEEGLCAYPAWLLLLFRTVYCVFSRRMLPPQSDVWLCSGPTFSRLRHMAAGIFLLPFIAIQILVSNIQVQIDCKMSFIYFLGKSWENVCPRI